MIRICVERERWWLETPCSRRTIFTSKHVLGGLNNSKITKEEVQGAVKALKAGKAAGLDVCAVECLKRGSAIVIEWLVRLLNVFL